MLDIFKDKKIWVSGHTGFKGSWLTLWLLRLGAIVRGYSLSPEYSNYYHFYNLELNDYKNFTQSFNDITNFCSVNNDICRFKPDIIIHLAAQSLVLDSYNHPSNTYNTNITGTSNVLESCREKDYIKGCCIVTTDKVYKNSESIYPMRESDRIGSSDPYYTSKACCELVIDSYRGWFKNYLSQNIIISSCRSGNVIGGGDFAKNRIVPDYIKAVSKGSEFILRNKKELIRIQEN